MYPPLKNIKSLIKEIEGLKTEGPEKIDLPLLTIKYEAWYTKALPVVQKQIPERLEDFVSAYKRDRSGAVNESTYTIQDYLLGIKANPSSKADSNYALLLQRLILRQVGILSSLLQSKPVSERTPDALLLAEFYNRALDQAQELFGMRKYAPAGVVAGALLENYLKWLWRRRNARVDEKQVSLSEMNDFLYRFQTYTHTTMIRIQGLIPLAESCLDPQKKNPSKKDIEALIAGLRKVLVSGPLEGLIGTLCSSGESTP
jgi:hypothetical protein